MYLSASVVRVVLWTSFQKRKQEDTHTTHTPEQAYGELHNVCVWEGRGGGASVSERPSK